MKNNLVGLIYGIVLLISFVESTSAQWVQMSKGAVASITSLAISDTQIFAATLNNGIYFSIDNGANWTAINSGLPASNITCLAVNGNNIFAGTSTKGVFLLTKNGSSWVATDTSLSGIQSLAVNGNNIFAGTYSKLYRSANNGTSWTEDNSGLGIYSVLSLAAIGVNILIGTNGGGVFTSSNSGASWTNVNSELSHSSVLCLAVSGNKIFAGVSPTIYNSPSASNTSAADSVGLERGVYLSSDNCTTWTAVNSGLSNVFMVYCFAVYGNSIFAGTSAGVFFSNNGTNWTNVDLGLADSTGSSIISIPVTYLVTTGNTIFAGTNKGVFRRPLSEMTSVIPKHQESIPLQTGIRSLVSGSVRSGVMVNYRLQSPCLVQLSIYTVSGKRVVLVENEEKTPGEYSFKLDACKIPAGLYMYRFQAGSYQESNRIMIMK